MVAVVLVLGLGEGAEHDVEDSLVRGGRHLLATEALEVDTKLAVHGVHGPALKPTVVLLRSSPASERHTAAWSAAAFSATRNLRTQRLALASRAPIAHDGILARALRVAAELLRVVGHLLAGGGSRACKSKSGFEFQRVGVLVTLRCSNLGKNRC